MVTPGNPDHGERVSNLMAWWARGPSWDFGPSYVLHALAKPRISRTQGPSNRPEEAPCAEEA